MIITKKALHKYLCHTDEEDEKCFAGSWNVAKSIKYIDPNRDHLYLYKAEMTAEGWERLGCYVSKNDHISEIFLECCGLSDEQVTAFFRSVVDRPDGDDKTNITLLILSTQKFGKKGVESIVPFIRMSPDLGIINFFGTKIGSDGFNMMMDVLDGTQIDQVCFASCNVDDVSILGDANLPNLNTLRLNNNNISSEGAEHIAALIRSGAPMLEYLHLGDNNLGDEGAIVLAGALAQNTSLRMLYLGKNNISEVGAEAIAKALSTNTSLVLLNLDDNEIGDAGTAAFSKVLCDPSSIHNSNHTIESIDLCNISVSPDIFRTLKASLQINKKHEGDPHKAAAEKVECFRQMQVELKEG